MIKYPVREIVDAFPVALSCITIKLLPKARQDDTIP